MMTVEGTDSMVTVLGTARSAFTIVKKRVVEVKEVDPAAAATTTTAATMTTTEPQEGSSGSTPLPTSSSGRQRLGARVVLIGLPNICVSGLGVRGRRAAPPLGALGAFLWVCGIRCLLTRG